MSTEREALMATAEVCPAARNSGLRPALPNRPGCLLSRLDFDIHIDERHRGRRDSGNAAGLAQRLRSHTRELFVHLARQAGDLAVIEPLGNGALLRFLKPLDRLGLLVEIAGVLDLGFDGLQL